MYKVCVIGLGNIGLMYDLNENSLKPASHTLAYTDNQYFGVIAGQDIRKGQQEYFKRLNNGALFYQDIKTMLEEVKPDVVSICTPPDQHLTNIHEVLAYSNPKVIFCEKPIVSNIHEIDNLNLMLKEREIVFLPNLSRRWSRGTTIIHDTIQARKLGALLKVHARYTRGIFNTGSHLFDLLKVFSGAMEEVRVWYGVSTSSDQDKDPSYTFEFKTDQGTTGFVEAFDDRHYYMFEIDLYFEWGKIDFRLSGDQVTIYSVDSHPLFPGFGHYKQSQDYSSLLSESNLQKAIQHIVEIIDGTASPICSLDDGVYPLLVAESLMHSFQTNHSTVKVNTNK